MILELKRILLDRWQDLLPEKDTPRDLTPFIMAPTSGPRLQPFGKTIILLFEPRSVAPVAVAMVVEDPRFAHRVEREYDNLRTVHQRFPQEMAEVIPRPLLLERIGADTVLVQTAVGGYPLLEILRSRDCSEAYHEQVWSMTTEWLLKTAALRNESSGSRQELARALVSSSHGYLQNYDVCNKEKRYIESLIDRMSHGGLADIPTVPMHGDYWVGNIYGHKQITGVIDWEYFQPAGLPLWDMCMLCLTLGKVYNGQDSREVAPLLRKCFSTDGALADKCGSIMDTYLQAMGLACDRAVIDDVVAWWLISMAMREYEAFGMHSGMDLFWRQGLVAFMDLQPHTVWRR